jgi:hypothetical protein
LLLVEASLASFLRHVLGSVACAAARALDDIAHPGLTVTLGPRATAEAHRIYGCDDPAVLGRILAHEIELRLERADEELVLPPQGIPEGALPGWDVLVEMGKQLEALRRALTIHESKPCGDVHIVRAPDELPG